MKSFLTALVIYLGVGAVLAAIWPVTFNPGVGLGKDQTWLGVMLWPWCLLRNRTGAVVVADDPATHEKQWLSSYSYRDLVTGEVIHINPTLK